MMRQSTKASVLIVANTMKWRGMTAEEQTQIRGHELTTIKAVNSEVPDRYDVYIKFI